MVTSNAELKQINSDRDWWRSACETIGATLIGWTYRRSALVSFKQNPNCDLDGDVAKSLVALRDLILAKYDLNDVTVETLETLKEIRETIASERHKSQYAQSTKKKPELPSVGPWKAEVIKNCGHFGGPVVWDSRIFNDPRDVPWGSWGCDLLQFRTIEQAYRVRDALNMEYQ